MERGLHREGLPQVNHVIPLLNNSLERTGTSRSGRFEFVAQWRLVRAAQPERYAKTRLS